jgi:hypothetical protein
MAKKVVKKKVDKKVEKEVQRKLRHILYERAKKHGSNFQQEFKKHVIVAVTAALGFLIALSWKDPILNLSNSLIASLGMTEGGIGFQFVAAGIVTVAAVLALILISGWSSEAK